VNDYSDGSFNLNVEIQNKAIINKKMKLYVNVQLFDYTQKLIFSKKEHIRIKKEDNIITLPFSTVIKEIKQWSAEKPNLYKLVISLESRKKELLDIVSAYTGFRTAEIIDGHFLINGKMVIYKANIESHGMGYGDKSLAKDSTWLNAHLNHTQRMF